MAMGECVSRRKTRDGPRNDANLVEAAQHHEGRCGDEALQPQPGVGYEGARGAACRDWHKDAELAHPAREQSDLPALAEEGHEHQRETRADAILSSMRPGLLTETPRTASRWRCSMRSAHAKARLRSSRKSPIGEKLRSADSYISTPIAIAAVLPALHASHLRLSGWCKSDSMASVTMGPGCAPPRRCQ